MELGVFPPVSVVDLLMEKGVVGSCSQREWNRSSC